MPHVTSYTPARTKDFTVVNPHSRAVIHLLTIVVFLGCVVASFAQAQAQTYIFGRADFPVGSGPISIAVGDLNSDGITDLAVVNETDNTVSILLGKYDGTFAPQVTYATGVGPLAIVTGDFNGDGNLDLAVTNAGCVETKAGLICSVKTVSILLGNGDGTFQPHFDYATGTQPSSVAAGDFNGDGKFDLAITNTQDSTVSVLLGNGDGTFQNQVVYPTVSGPQSMIAADFNGDHQLDLAVGGTGPVGASEVSVLLGNGDGTFQKSLTSQGDAPLAAADFNLDGKLDLFAGGDVLLGNGDGTFVLHATYPNGKAVAAADLNADGKPDLVIGGGGDNLSSVAAISVLLGNGDGTFQTEVQYGMGAAYVLIADFNGDGKLDVAGANLECTYLSCSPSAALSILLGFGDGSFVGPKDYSSAPASEVISADFNGDGKPDIAASEDGTLINVLLANGDGTFQSPVTTTLTQSAGQIAAGDFNGDGKADLATVFSNCSGSTCLPGDAVVLIGNGDGTFQSPVEYSVGLDPKNLAVGDFNGDGKPDLAVSNNGANTVSILLNNGNGTFQPHMDYATEPASPAVITTGDFNGDGKLDLALASTNDNTVSVLLGNGDGTFQSYRLVPLPYQPWSLATSDFNEDGKLDLAVTDTSGNLDIFLGNGDGTFQTSISYWDGFEYGMPSVGDFDGDGIPDLIVGDFIDVSAEIFLGKGDGTFQAPILSFLSNGRLAVADFNHDGSPDVAGGSPSPVVVSVILSNAFKAISPASLNFGFQGVGTTSGPLTITISNPSNVSLNIAGIAVSGNFAQTNDCGSSLAIGSHCVVAVTFAPIATGLESGAITITDSTRISPLAIPLSGTGVNGSFLTTYPSRANFPPQAVGTTSTPAVLLLVNTGNASLNITGISVTGANNSDFTQTNNCGSSLPSAGNCTVNVTFTPTAAGFRTANIAVSDTASGRPQTANLAGTGLGPTANLSPNVLAFASQVVGTASAAQLVNLLNMGSTALSITSIAASGDFGETNTCNTSLAAGSSCQISVTFTPTASGSRAGSLTITDNAAGSPQTVALSGVGIATPDFTFDAGSGGSSQTISAGQTAAFNLNLTPTGSFSGTVNLTCAITPAATPAPVCSVPSSVSVTGSTAAAVTVTVATTASGTAAGMSSANFPAGPRLMDWRFMLIASGLLFVGSRRRLPALAALITFLVFMAMTGCGNGSPSRTGGTGTPAGTYTATITGTSGNVSHQTALTVIVQ